MGVNSIASTMNVIGMQKIRGRKGRFMYMNLEEVKK